MTDMVLVQALVDSVKFAKSANPDPELRAERARSFVSSLAGILEVEGGRGSTRYAVLAHAVWSLVSWEDAE